MAATIGKVRAVFTASTSGLTAGVNAASASMRRMEASVASLRGPLNSLVAIQGAQLFGSIASTVSQYAQSLAGLVSSTTEAVSAQNDLASRLGLTYAELSGLTLAGSMVGVSMDQIGGAMTRAQVAFSNAANGSKPAIAAFERIGLSVAELNGLSAEEQFEAIAQAISELPTEAERAAAAVRIFGRAGAQLLPLFNEGAAGIQAARAEADRFGLSLTNAQAGNVDAMGDSFDRAKAAIQGVINQVVAYLAPAVTSVTTAFSDLIGNVGGANIGQAIGEGILQGARYLAQVGDYIVAQVPKVWQYVSQVGAQWGVVFDIGKRLFSFVAGVARLFEAAFKFVGSVLVGVLGRTLNAVGELAQFVPGMGQFGRDTEKAGEQLMQTSSALWSEAGAAMSAAGTNFYDAAFGGQKPEQTGEAIAGPLTQTIDQALAAAQDATQGIDTAAKQTVEVSQVVDGGQVGAVVAGRVKDAVQGIESNSAEGIKEMFRIMRGDTGDQTQERIARGIEQIVDNTADFGDGMDLDVADLAPAAGG